MNRKIVLCFALVITVMCSIFSVYYSLGQIQQPIFITISDQISCLSVVRGQDAMAIWTPNRCSITGSSVYSPIYLTNSSTTIIIPRSTNLTLYDGLGFASYGTIQVIGDLIVNTALINYGQITNSKTGLILVNTLLLSLNTTSQNFGETGIVNNSGTLQVNKNGFMDNGNLLINLGTLVNDGTIYNFVAGLNYSSSVVNSGTIKGVPIQTSINATSKTNTTITAKTTISGSGCVTC